MLLRKPSWLNEATWRTLRTLFAIFAGVMGGVLIAVLTGYSQTHVFDFSALWYDGVIVGLIAAITYAMNRKRV